MITLFAMTKKGYEVLAALVASFGGSFIDKVIGAKDANIDEDCYEDIATLCRNECIAFFNRTDSFDIATKYSFAISWRWLIHLPEGKELVVFHDSLLPKYRGFAPLVNSLINAEPQIGVTALFANKEYDRGDIIFQSATAIQYPITIKEAIERVAQNYREACLSVAAMIRDGQALPHRVQNEEEATYSLWRDEEDYNIDWTADAAQILRFVDATGFPYKGAAAVVDGKKIRIRSVELVDDITIVNRTAGKVVFMKEDRPVVVCGKGLLRIVEAEEENGGSLFPMKKFRVRFL